MPVPAGAEKWTQAWRHLDLVASMGWDAKLHDLDNVVSAAPRSYLYIYDLATGWSWLGAVNHEGFRQVSDAGKKGLVSDRRDIVAALSELVVGHAGRRVALDAEQHRELAILTSFYAGGTKSYAAAQGFPDGAHFVVIVYRNPGHETVNLRPFAMKLPPDRPVAADVLAATLRQVITMDKSRHPEWLEGKKDE